MEIKNIQSENFLLKPEVDPDKFSAENKIDTDKIKEIIEKAKLDSEKVKIDDTEKKSIDIEDIEKIVDALNNFLRVFDSKINFQIHQGADRLFVRVLDVETDKVLREIPDYDALELVAKIRDFVGLLVDERV